MKQFIIIIFLIITTLPLGLFGEITTIMPGGMMEVGFSKTIIIPGRVHIYPVTLLIKKGPFDVSNYIAVDLAGSTITGDLIIDVLNQTARLSLSKLIYTLKSGKTNSIQLYGDVFSLKNCYLFNEDETRGIYLLTITQSTFRIVLTGKPIVFSNK